MGFPTPPVNGEWKQNRIACSTKELKKAAFRRQLVEKFTKRKKWAREQLEAYYVGDMHWRHSYPCNTAVQTARFDALYEVTHQALREAISS